MADEQQLVPFYQGHTSLMSVIPPYVSISAIAMVIITIALVWSRRARKKDTDPAA